MELEFVCSLILWTSNEVDNYSFSRDHSLGKDPMHLKVHELQITCPRAMHARGLTQALTLDTRSTQVHGKLIHFYLICVSIMCSNKYFTCGRPRRSTKFNLLIVPLPVIIIPSVFYEGKDVWHKSIPY